MHSKDRPSGAALFFSLQRVAFCHRVSSFFVLSLSLRAWAPPCRPPQRARGPLSGDSSLHRCRSVERVTPGPTHCLVSRYRFSVHTDTADAAHFASHQDVVLPARAVAFIHVMHLGHTLMSNPIAPRPPAFNARVQRVTSGPQCCESWENCPLELHRVPVDPIHIFETCFQRQFNLAFPCFDWFSTDTSQTEH